MGDLLKRVSIVVVTYKGDDLTRDCLNSIAITCDEAPQIVVVDNSPSELTRDIVRAHSNAVYVESPGNPGFAGGNNLAIPFCDRPYVLLLNNDTIVHAKESIEKLVEFLDAHDDCAAVQGTGRLPRVQNTLGGCGSFLTQYGTLWTTGFMVPEDFVHDQDHPCFAVGGFFFMFRKSVLPSVGGMPFYDHFWCYYEEVDFCHRLWLAGYEVWYVHTTPITHLLSCTSDSFRHAVIMRQYLRNILFSLCANLSLGSRLKMLPRFIALLVGHAVVSFLKGRFADGASDMAAIAWTWRDRRLVSEARRRVSALRKRTDCQVFKKTMYRVGIVEFLKKLISRK